MPQGEKGEFNVNIQLYKNLNRAVGWSFFFVPGGREGGGAVTSLVPNISVSNDNMVFRVSA